MNEVDLKKFKEYFNKEGRFPSYSTLLFLMSYLEMNPDSELSEMLKVSIDASLGALPTDPTDTAMHVWIYSVGFKVFGDEKYKEVALQLVDEPFVPGGSVFWDSLSGVGYVMAHRYLGSEAAKKIADTIFKENADKDFKNEDLAGMLFLATYLFEDSFDGKDVIKAFYEKLKEVSFEEREDLPMPSARSVALLALHRAKLILDITEELRELQFAEPLHNDFYNLFVFMHAGNCHDLHVPERISWLQLPLNVVQMPGTLYLDCYKKMCKMFKSKEELLKIF
ncbi:hypothetical protein KKC94_05090 [Patescibacteria group bacterium]|nr:hypothetical protein [Patescibacteria group bacterium]